jgi:hypothetical protein
MADEQPGIETGHVDPLAGWRDLTVDELMARKAEYEENGIRFYNILRLNPEDWAALAGVWIFAKAFLETLGKRAGDGLADLVGTHVRRKGKPDQYEIGVDDGSAATIAIATDTPDEARLALLDLDVTAEGVRGKVLHWDSAADAWRAADGE